MPSRTQITIDAALRQRAHARAEDLGVSFAEYVRRLLERDLGEQPRRPDVSAIFDLVEGGAETDIARNKDSMIAGAILADHKRKTRA